MSYPSKFHHDWWNRISLQDDRMTPEKSWGHASACGRRGQFGIPQSTGAQKITEDHAKHDDLLCS